MRFRRGSSQTLARAEPDVEEAHEAGVENGIPYQTLMKSVLV